MSSVLRRRDFALLWFAGLVSIAGDWMLFVALPVAVYDITGSAAALSGVVVVRLTAGVALSSVAGVFVDRWDRKRTMVVANLVRGPMLLLLLLVDTPADMWLVYLVAFINSAFSTFFGPAENALLPRLVPETDLVPANALNSLNNTIGQLVGPALGGVVGAWLGLGGVVAIDAATYLIAGVLVAAIATSGRPEQDHTGTTAPEVASEAIGAWRGVWREWLAGMRLVRASRTLSLVFAATAVFAVGDVGYSALLAVWVSDVLGGGAREFGWLVTGQAIGGMLGAALLASWGRGAPLRRMLGWGMVGMGVIDVAFVTYPTVVDGVWLGILLRVVIGVPVMTANTSATALLHRPVPRPGLRRAEHDLLARDPDPGAAGRVCHRVGRYHPGAHDPQRGIHPGRVGLVAPVGRPSVRRCEGGRMTLLSRQQDDLGGNLPSNGVLQAATIE